MDAVDRLEVSILGAYLRVAVLVDEVGPDARLRLQLSALSDHQPEAAIPASVLRDWKIVQGMQRDFWEVQQSLECLGNIPTYLRRFPYRSLGISPSGYLQYHFENWFNEVYILDERLKTFLQRLKRAYRKSSQARDVDSAVDEALRLFALGIAEARVIRGGHVHRSRVVDRDILMLSSSELIVAQHPDAPFDPEAEFRRVRRQKAAEIDDLNGLIRISLDRALDPVCEAVIVWELPKPWIRLPAPV